MPVELSWLSASAALFFLYLCGEIVTGNRQYSPKQLLGTRDTLPPLSTGLSRAKRATANMIESMTMFVPLVLVAVVADRTNSMTALGCAVFVIARAVYLPLYWFGVPVLRTLAWVAGLVGIGLVFFQVLPFTGAN